MGNRTRWPSATFFVDDFHSRLKKPTRKTLRPFHKLPQARRGFNQPRDREKPNSQETSLTQNSAHRQEVRTMAKTINPKVTITEGKTIQTIWTGIPDSKMGTRSGVPQVFGMLLSSVVRCHSGFRNVASCGVREAGISSTPKRLCAAFAIRRSKSILIGRRDSWAGSMRSRRLSWMP